jgi:bacillithiol biosynthesis cysteine-adding enzyme BshC
MKSSNIELSKLTTSTKLYADYMSGNTGDLIGYGFLDKDAPTQISGVIDGRIYDRQKLYDIVRSGNAGFNSSNKTLNNIEFLKNPHSLCVFAGQQTGVLFGPMYTIYKALATVKLAAKYQSLLGRPVIPCFWMATDDHDFEEVRSANFLNRTGELVNIVYTPAKDYGGIPVTDMIFDDGINDFINQVENGLMDTEFKSELMPYLNEIYRPGIRFAETFARLFNRFLGDFGIVLVDPNFPGMKELFKEVFIKEIEHHKQTFELFTRRSDQLHNSGYHNQVHKTGETLNLFYHNPARVNINIDADIYRIDNSNQKYSQSSLYDKVNQSPQQFSPNVLLRPIAQCYAFPTLCQVTGPSELAYYIQILPLFDYFNIPAPIIFPRPGMTLIEPHIGKTIDKYALDIGLLKHDPDLSISAAIERLFPSDAAQAIALIQEELKRDLDNSAGTIQNSDPEGYQAVSNFAKRFDFEFNELQKKLKATNKKRHDDIRSQIKKGHDFLFPDNKLQERVISPIYFINKFGPEIFNKIYAGLDIDNAKHILLEL